VRLLKDEGVQSSVKGFYTEEEMKLRAIFDSSPDAITVTDLNGNIVARAPEYFVAITKDITERRLMEQKYTTIVKTALDGFWINDSKGRFIAVNDAYCEMIGYTREELLSMFIPDIEASEKPEETAEHIRKILKEGYDRFETCHRRKDGTVIDVEVGANYYSVGEGQLVVFIRDITEHKNMERQLKEYSEHLEEKVEEKTNQLKNACMHAYGGVDSMALVGCARIYLNTLPTE